MYMSKVLNLKIHENNAKHTLFKNVAQGRAIWVGRRKPQRAKLGGKHSEKWNVSLRSSNSFVESYI